LHYGRIVALVGVIVTAVGLFMKSLSSAAEDIPDFMAGVSAQTGGAVPAEFPTVWTGIWNDKPWASVLLVLALLAIVLVAFMPQMKEAMSRMNGLVSVVLGVVVMVIGGVATLSAMDDADAIEGAYAQAAAALGMTQAPTVSITIGWTLLIVGGALAAIGGVLALIARPDESAIPGTEA